VQDLDIDRLSSLKVDGLGHLAGPGIPYPRIDPGIQIGNSLLLSGIAARSHKEHRPVVG
jgi:hypothetical protein